MRLRLRRALGVLELLALGAVCATLARVERENQPRPAQSGSALSGVIITGYVLDAATGKPIRDAQVSTVPATETAVTNGQGLYVLSLGASFGTVTVVADARRYRQVRSTCVSVKAGLNTLGDVVLLHEDEDVDDTCPTECAAGEQCRLGHCVPGCAPACECTDICEAGECVPNENVPGADSCGNNATWLGGGLCACKPGYVVSTYGRNCVSATQATNCPENAFATESGCACSQGFVPNRDGDQCGASQAGAQLRGIDRPERLGREPGGAHAQEPEAPEHEVEHQRAQRHRADVRRIGRLAHHRGIDHADERRGHVRHHDRCGDRQHRAMA